MSILWSAAEVPFVVSSVYQTCDPVVSLIAGPPVLVKVGVLAPSASLTYSSTVPAREMIFTAYAAQLRLRTNPVSLSLNAVPL